MAITLYTDLDNAIDKLATYAYDSTCTYQTTFQSLLETLTVITANIEMLDSYLQTFMLDPKYAVFSVFKALDYNYFINSISNTYKNLLDGNLTNETIITINNLPDCSSLTQTDVDNVSTLINNLNTTVNNKLLPCYNIESLADTTIKYVSKIPQIAKVLLTNLDIKDYIGYNDNILQSVSLAMIEYYGDQNLMISTGFLVLDETLSITQQLLSNLDSLKIT